MERDFMGLKPEDVAVKEECVEGGCEDSGYARSSGVPLANKEASLPQFISLSCKQDEKPSKNELPAYPMHPFSMKQQFLGGNTHAVPYPVIPSAASMAGTTEHWINSKAFNAPAKLTIFYGGTVNVFDDISPEKAQAIMLLAGNMYVQSKMSQSKLHMHSPASKLPATDQPLVNQSMNTPPSSGFTSPMSVSSHPIDQFGIPGANNDDVKVSKTGGMSSLPMVMSSLGSIAASAIMSSAVPQARKASLARFLEKRKERVMSAAAPYNKGKNGAGDCKTPDSNDFGFSATSGISSTSG